VHQLEIKVLNLIVALDCKIMYVCICIYIYIYTYIYIHTYIFYSQSFTNVRCDKWFDRESEQAMWRGMNWNRGQGSSDRRDGNGNDINQCKWLCLDLQANIQGRQLLHIKMLLGRVNGRTVQREWGRKKLYTMLDEKCKKMETSWMMGK